MFLYFFSLFTEEEFVFSPCFSLEFCIQMGLSFLFSFAFHFSSFLSYLQGLLNNHFAFLHFFFLGLVLVTTCYIVLQTSIHSCIPQMLHLVYVVCSNIKLLSQRKFQRTKIYAISIFHLIFSWCYLNCGLEIIKLLAQFHI